MGPETIYSLIASVLVLGLLYFILYNAINNSNYMRKGIIFLAFGLIIFGITLSGVLYDLNKGAVLSLRYLAFPLINLVFLLIFSIYFFSSAKKYNHSLRKFKKTTTRNINNYLYVVIRYEDFYLLDGKDKLKGVVIKFDKDVSFHDEMINRFIAITKTSVADKKYVGKVVVDNKVESIYYCYKIEILNISDSLSVLSQVNKFDIYQKPMLDFDKEIILRMLIARSTDPFVIKK
ncbi:MAG: hypothetical protein WDA47_07875 [Bacilli bacterium]